MSVDHQDRHRNLDSPSPTGSRSGKMIRGFVTNSLLILAILAGAHWWQTRTLLPSGGTEAAPNFTLMDMDGTPYELHAAKGRTVVLYFMAPWCGVCHRSIDSLQKIRDSKKADDVAIYVIALDYENTAEVSAFLAQHKLDVPVLLGTSQTQRDYRISAFPTYYILDKQGNVQGHAVGYTTELGLRMRLL